MDIDNLHVDNGKDSRHVFPVVYCAVLLKIFLYWVIDISNKLGTTLQKATELSVSQTKIQKWKKYLRRSCFICSYICKLFDFNFSGIESVNHRHFHIELIVVKIVGCSNTCTGHSANDLELLGLSKKVKKYSQLQMPWQGQHWFSPQLFRSFGHSKFDLSSFLSKFYRSKLLHYNHILHGPYRKQNAMSWFNIIPGFRLFS